jgi:uncharacterized protein (UPF0335 family)
MGRRKSAAARGRVDSSTNSIDEKAEPFLIRIENLHVDLEALRSRYLKDCKAVREDLKAVYVEGKDNGVPVKSLKGLVKWRELERKQEAIAARLDDIDEAAIYSHLVESLGPLGQAAARSAGYGADVEAEA